MRRRKGERDEKEKEKKKRKKEAISIFSPQNMPGVFSLYHFWQVVTHIGSSSTSTTWSRRSALEIAQIKLGGGKKNKIKTKTREFKKWQRGERRPDPQQSNFLHLLFAQGALLVSGRLWARQRNICKWEKQLTSLTENEMVETAGMSPAPFRETAIISETYGKWECASCWDAMHLANTWNCWENIYWGGSGRDIWGTWRT